MSGNVEREAPVESATAEALDVRSKKLQTTCILSFGQGELGFRQVQRLVSAAPTAPWVLNMPLNEAVTADSLRCLRYLIDIIKVRTLDVVTKGYTPLQLSIIWGRLDIMVYLLSRGADAMLGTTSSVVDKARLRQQRLQEALDRSGDGVEFEGVTVTKRQIEPLIEIGLVMLEILEGVEKCGSYFVWAENNASHRLVKRFSGDISCVEPRYQLVVLRSLVHAGKASLFPEAERAARWAEAEAQAAEQAREEQELMDALIDADFSAQSSKEIRDTFRTPTVKSLRALKLSAEDIEAALERIVRNRRITEGEQRKFIRYVRELEESAENKPAATASNATVKAKAASKSKAKAAPAAKAALLALGSKGAGRNSSGYPQGKNPQVRKKKAAIDGMALAFDADLPIGAFILITRFLRGI